VQLDGHKINAFIDTGSQSTVLSTSAALALGLTPVLLARDRAAILRGGSYYRPEGSRWYFPQVTKLNEHGKYLLMAPSKDRAGTLGFRCVMDSASGIQ